MGDAFNDNVTQADLDGLVTEATNRDQLLMMRVSANIHNLRDIPILNDRYNHLLNEYQEINVLRTDSEDQDKEIERKLKTFMLELNSLKEEINATDEEEMVVLVIKDYLDQVSDLKKKLGSIRSMTSNEIVTPNVTQEEEDRDGVTFDATYTVDDWIVKTRRKLLLQKEVQEKENRRRENQDKVMLQETLKVASRTKIRNLDSRRVFLPWHEDYQKLKASFKKNNLSDWKENVLKVAKESLKIQADIDAFMFLTGLKEFESYISTEYIVGVNMLNDLFSKLFTMNKASDISESITMTTEALNIIRTAKARN